jgi:general secretion pathway protein G
MRVSKYFLITIAAIIIIVLAIAIPNFIRARSTSAANPCVNNLRIFQAAKEQWALERGKTTNDVPTWDDVRPYLPDRWSNSIPVCPYGGTYTLGRVGVPPTCSIGGPKNSLPQ